LPLLELGQAKQKAESRVEMINDQSPIINHQSSIINHQAEDKVGSNWWQIEMLELNFYVFSHSSIEQLIIRFTNGYICIHWHMCQNFSSR
jgi:hypothetical protein